VKITGYCQDNDFDLKGERSVENWLVAEINKQQHWKRKIAGYYESKSEADYINSCMNNKNAVVMTLTDFKKIRLKEI